MRKVYILLLILFLLPFTSAWWDSSWSYKKLINVSVPAGITLEDYQVLLNISYDAHMQADFDDLRFINGSENTELDYWLESKVNSAYASIWVEVDQNITTSNYSFYMYYGNTTVSSASNPYTTFELYDNFTSPSASINTTFWIPQTALCARAASGTPSVSGGILEAVSDSSHYQGVYSNISTFGLFKPNITIELLYHDLGAGRSRTGSVGFHERETRYCGDDNAFYADYDSEHITKTCKANTCYTNTTWDIIADPGSGWTIIRIEWHKNQTRYYFNDTLHSIASATYTPIIGLNVTLASDRTQHIYVDWVRVYKKQIPGPSSYFGAEESASTCTCAGAGTNWEINMSDYCNITSDCDLTTGTLSFTGSGETRVNATITTTNLGDPGVNGILFMQDSGLIWVKV